MEEASIKYQRNLTAKPAKDKKLRSNLKRLDEKYRAAAKSAAGTEYLLAEQAGFLEAEGEIEKTYKFRQAEIKEAVDIQTKKRAFNLELNDLGPYCADYSRTGNSLLLGGRKGHIAAFDWKVGELNAEIQVGETVRAVKWLQSDNAFFAAAQKKYTFIYDKQGVEVHCLKKHIEATHLDYLPFHFLLVSAGKTGFIKYQDVTTGGLVAELRTKLGETTALSQNSYNAVMHAGHSNGTVTLWSPTMSEPLVKILSARGPIRAVACNRDGRYMVAAGADKSLKIWDIRNFKELHSYYSPTPASSISISDSGVVAVGWGPHVQLWKDVLTTDTTSKQSAPYMNHLIPGSQINSVRFCPFEDILGVGHDKGFSSLIVPGSGEANFDALEVNPYASATKKGRRETEVRDLLNKLKPEMITLDPETLGTVAPKALSERLTAAEAEARSLQSQETADERSKVVIKPSVKGKNSGLRAHMRKHTANVIDRRRMLIEANLKREKQLRQRNFERRRKGLLVDEEDNDPDELGPALARFK